jgi:hypothetical protein
MQQTRTPVFIRLGNRSHPFNYAKNGVRGILIQDIHASEALLASSITGIPGHMVENAAITGLTTTAIAGNQPVVKLKTTSHVWLRDCASAAAASFIATEGGCSDILV